MLAATRFVAPVAPVASKPSRGALVIQNAQKKGAGSTKNGRDSEAKRRGVKVFGGQPCRAGGIIVRQVGTKFHPGDNCDLGKDFTVFSTVEGIVIFSQKDGRKLVNVYPLDHAKAQAAIKATHTTPVAEGQQSRRERRLAAYKGKPRKNAAAAAAAASS